MDVPPVLWLATIGALVGVIALDLVVVSRQSQPFGVKAATRWVIFYVSLAALFAVGVGLYFGWGYSGAFVAGYLTEYSLSVDNLFVFMLIMSSFAVPAAYQHRVLLVGIVIALVLRGILILIGAELINRFSVVFYLFAAFLLFTAWKVWSADSEDDEVGPEGNALVSWVSNRFPTSTEYHGTALTTRVAGRRALTPMALVMITIGTTDILFAIDSIPAVFGITQEDYLVFTANAFALMGLRQLYFLLQGVLGKLEHLNKGLAIILAFIGFKLLLEALHATTSLSVPEIPIWFSLTFIIAVLVGTAALSLRRTR